jgi:Sugar kinases, ribokinase family
MKKILLFGEPMALLTTTEVVSLDDAKMFQKSLAGAEVNVAIGLTRLGHQATYFTVLGDDPWGRYMKKKLKEEMIDTSLVFFEDKYPSGMMLKNQVSEGDPDIYYYRKGSAFSHIDINWIKQIDLSQYDQLHITGIPLALSQETRQTSFELVKKAKEAGVYISYDPNLRPSLWEDEGMMIKVTNEMARYCDMMLPGIREGKILMGSDNPQEISQFFIQQGAKEIVIKLGEKGAYYANENESFVVEGFHVQEVVDTVGAGDGFAVGIISARIENMSKKEILTRGNAIGAMQVMTLGDNEGLPNRQKLEQFIKSRI